MRVASRRDAAKARPKAPPEMPLATIPPPFAGSGSSQPESAGVIVIATTKDQASIATTEIATVPTKSPEGPGSRIIGMKVSAVVTVEASSGAASRPTASPTASTRAMPAARRRRISSVITMAASTSRPSATIMPVTDIW